MEYFKTCNLTIRDMKLDDIKYICEADGDNSEENMKYLQNQLENQDKKMSKALLAVYKGKVAGYAFLFYKLKWGGLGYMGLPGIADLLIFKEYRRMGIAGKLMDIAESLASKHSDKIYLEVCLNSDYGVAQRMYIKRGYVPDGKGVYYESKVCPTDAPCKNDDELTLCLIKDL